MPGRNRGPPTATRLLCGVLPTRWHCNQRVSRLTAHSYCLRIIDHCRAHVFVAQEFLNCANIVTVFKQVSSERMTKTVAHGRFGYPCLSHSVFHGLL
jgi:hypothetical protein